MNISYVRASSVTQFLDCQYKYYLINQLGLVDATGRKAALGNCIHLCLELLAKGKKTGHFKLKNDKFNDHKYLLGIIWKRHCKTYRGQFECPDEDYEFCLKNVETVLNDKLFNPVNQDVFATELQFEIVLERPEFQYIYFNPITNEVDSGFLCLRGTIDLISMRDGGFFITDYKSGMAKDWLSGQPKSFENCMTDKQLLLYNLALSILFPKIKKRVFTLYYTQKVGPITVSFNKNDEKLALQILKDHMDSVLKAEKLKRLKDDGSQKHRHFVCKYVCGFNKNGICDKYYSEFINSGSYIEGTQRLHQLSIEGRPAQGAVSRRNDYGRDKIMRAIYK